MADTPLEEIRAALFTIPASVPRDEWARVAMAIKSDLPGDDGLTLFDEWSQGYPEKYRKGDTRSTWRSVTPAGGVTIATLFYIAKQHGYKLGKPPGLSSAERVAREQRWKEIQAQGEAQELARQEETATVAADLWKSAKVVLRRRHAPVTSNIGGPRGPDYLDAKDIEPHGIKAGNEGYLVPLRDVGGKLWNLQTIRDIGQKRFLPGGRVKGCYFSIGKPEGAVIVCEGFATGASIHEATGQAVAVAFTAGNLPAVTQALRQRYPDIRLIVAADDDSHDAGNPGLTKATAAAQAVGGLLAVPVFPKHVERTKEATDFNDLHRVDCKAAVKACIETAKPVDPPANETGPAFPPLEDDFSMPTEEKETPDVHRNAPRPSPDCLYGLIGEIAKAEATHTEANPFAVAANLMAYVSSAIGRGPFLPVGNEWHHARLFTLHVGRTSEGRKGTAMALLFRIAKKLKEIAPDDAPKIHSGGLSSREGLILKIPDAYTVGDKDQEGTADKRLFVAESEFVNVLAQGKREGNTLSAALRDIWDGKSIFPAVKVSPIGVTDPHVCIAAAITPSELKAKISEGELSSGFINRFLVFFAERHQKEAFPQETSKEMIEHFARRILEVLQFCQSARFAENDNMRMEISREARERYKGLYYGELSDKSHGERIHAMITRRESMLKRIAMLFALCDLTTVIDVKHIDAAMAWMRYWLDSVKFVFASGADEIEVQEVNDTAAKVLAFLTEHGRVTRWELMRDCFKGHEKASRVDAALQELLTTTPPRIVIETERTPGSKTPTKIYILAKSAKPRSHEKSEDSCGLQGIAPFAQSSEDCEVMEDEGAKTSQASPPPRSLETRMDTSSSQTSQTSRTNFPPPSTARPEKEVV